MFNLVWGAFQERIDGGDQRDREMICERVISRLKSESVPVKRRGQTKMIQSHQKSYVVILPWTHKVATQFTECSKMSNEQERKFKSSGIDSSRSGRGTWSPEEDQIIIDCIDEVRHLFSYFCFLIAELT